MRSCFDVVGILCDPRKLQVRHGSWLAKLFSKQEACATDRIKSETHVVCAHCIIFLCSTSWQADNIIWIKTHFSLFTFVEQKTPNKFYQFISNFIIVNLIAVQHNIRVWHVSAYLLIAADKITERYCILGPSWLMKLWYSCSRWNQVGYEFY